MLDVCHNVMPPNVATGNSPCNVSYHIEIGPTCSVSIDKGPTAEDSGAGTFEEKCEVTPELPACGSEKCGEGSGSGPLSA